MGCVRSQVRILSPRPNPKSHISWWDFWFKVPHRKWYLEGSTPDVDQIEKSHTDKMKFSSTPKKYFLVSIAFLIITQAAIYISGILYTLFWLKRMPLNEFFIRRSGYSLYELSLPMINYFSLITAGFIVARKAKKEPWKAGIELGLWWILMELGFYLIVTIFSAFLYFLAYPRISVIPGAMEKWQEWFIHPLPSGHVFAVQLICIGVGCLIAILVTNHRLLRHK
jgi:hypothetical protein